jgi:pimeloyl-ACP methyl ester carboxylesterase
LTKTEVLRLWWDVAGGILNARHVVEIISQNPQKTPIVMFPGFMAGDWSTRMPRALLELAGFPTYVSGINVHWGFKPERDILKNVEFLDRIAQRHGIAAVLGGHSLGGTAALGHALHPSTKGLVSGVAAYGSPLNPDPNAVPHIVGGLYRRLNGPHSMSEGDVLLSSFHEGNHTAPVISLSADGDGVVSPWASRVPNGKLSQYLHLEDTRKSHLGLIATPECLFVLAHLAAHAGRPFEHLNPEDYPGFFGTAAASRPSLKEYATAFAASNAGRRAALH